MCVCDLSYFDVVLWPSSSQILATPLPTPTHTHVVDQSLCDQSRHDSRVDRHDVHTAMQRCSQ